MGIVTTRDRFALAISGPMAAKFIRPNSSNEEVGLIADAIWKLADAMATRQAPPSGAAHG